jgi:hypothetical protein
MTRIELERQWRWVQLAHHQGKPLWKGHAPVSKNYLKKAKKRMEEILYALNTAGGTVTPPTSSGPTPNSGTVSPGSEGLILAPQMVPQPVPHSELSIPLAVTAAEEWLKEHGLTLARLH